MDAYECIMTRRSIRKFKKIPVEWYKLGQIVEAATMAPSAGNLIDFRLMAITKESLKQEIAKLCMNQTWMCDAAFYVIVYSAFTKTKRFYGIRGERLYSIQSAAAAAQSVLLAAHALGLGACWVGAFDEDNIKHIINLPDYYRIAAIIPIGYPDENPPMPPKNQLEIMLHLNKWGDNSGKVWNVFTELTKDWSPHTTQIIDNSIAMVKKGNEKLGESIVNGVKKLHGHLKGKLKDAVKTQEKTKK